MLDAWRYQYLTHRYPDNSAGVQVVMYQWRKHMCKLSVSCIMLVTAQGLLCAIPSYLLASTRAQSAAHALPRVSAERSRCARPTSGFPEVFQQRMPRSSGPSPLRCRAVRVKRPSHWRGRCARVSRSSQKGKFRSLLLRRAVQIGSGPDLVSSPSERGTA